MSEEFSDIKKIKTMKTGDKMLQMGIGCFGVTLTTLSSSHGAG